MIVDVAGAAAALQAADDILILTHRDRTATRQAVPVRSAAVCSRLASAHIFWKIRRSPGDMRR